MWPTRNIQNAFPDILHFYVYKYKCINRILCWNKITHKRDDGTNIFEGRHFNLFKYYLKQFNIHLNL